MKFTFFTPYTIPDYSGSGLNAFRFASYLNQTSHTAKICTLNRNLFLKRNEIHQNVKIRRIAYFNKNLLLKVVSAFIILPAYITEIYKTDAIIIYGGKMYAYQMVILLGKLFNKKIVFRSTMNGLDGLNDITKAAPKIIQFIYKQIFKKIDIYFALNKDFANQYYNIFEDTKKVLLSTQGVNTKYFKRTTDGENIRVQLGIPTGKFVLLSVGFLLNRKGYKGLFEQLAKLNNDFLLVLVGEYNAPVGHFLSPFNNEMRALKVIGEQLLPNRLLFAGGQRNVLTYYQVADAFVHNSVQEGVPNVVLEAMACSLPVICKEFKGIDKQLFRHNHTCFIYSNDNAINGHVKNLIDNENIRNQIGGKARTIIEKNHSFKNVANNLVNMLNKLPSTL